MAFTLSQISNTHLGAGILLFRANLDRVAAALHGTWWRRMAWSGHSSTTSAMRRTPGEAR